MKLLLEQRDDVVFYIKLLPLKIHPAAYKKSKSIVCDRSLRQLERAFDGKAIPEPRCETTEIDDNIEFAERMGITGTPTIILPDGGVVSGMKDAETLMLIIEESGQKAEEVEARRMAEAEAQRLERLRALDYADFQSAGALGTIEAYEAYLSKYDEPFYRAEAVEAMAKLINGMSERFELFKKFVLKYPEGIRHIPEIFRFYYYGPPELPLYRIIEMRDLGYSAQDITHEIISIEGDYGDLTTDQFAALRKSGLSEGVISAIVQSTLMSRQRAAQERRLEQIRAISSELEGVHAEMEDLSGYIERQGGDHSPAERAMLERMLASCRDLLAELELCKANDHMSAEACIVEARERYLCTTDLPEEPSAVPSLLTP